MPSVSQKRKGCCRTPASLSSSLRGSVWAFSDDKHLTRGASVFTQNRDFGLLQQLRKEHCLCSLIHPLLIQQTSVSVLYIVLGPEPETLMDVVVSAFVTWERHVHKFISKGHWEQACIFK